MNANFGTLYVVSTPIGNLKDITLRALGVLAQVDYIVAEDSRHSKRLLDHFQIKTPFASSYYQGVERQRVDGLLEWLRAGKNLALISDAGTPLLNDPGYPLVHRAVEAGIAVVPVPGPSALMAALVMAGFPTDRFIFDGNPPKKTQARRDYFRSLQTETRTVLLYESAHRILKTLEEISRQLPERRLALCRELTKLHEEALHGTAGELLEELQQRTAIKGELVLLLHGTTAQQSEPLPERWALQVQAAIERGADRKAAIKAVAQRHGVPKRAVFNALERAKNSEDKNEPQA